MRTNEHTRDASLYRANPDEHGIGRAHDHAEQPSATDAVERVFDAGQRLVTERIELAKLDIQDAVTEKASQAVRIVVPGLFAFGGWWFLMAGLVAFLDTFLVLPTSLAIVGGAHVAVGGVVALAALKRGQHTRNGGSHPAGAQP